MVYALGGYGKEEVIAYYVASMTEATVHNRYAEQA